MLHLTCSLSSGDVSRSRWYSLISCEKKQSRSLWHILQLCIHMTKYRVRSPVVMHCHYSLHWLQFLFSIVYLPSLLDAQEGSE